MAFKDEFGLLRSSFISCSQLLFAWFTWTFSSEENEVWGKFLQTDLEVGFFEIKFFFFCNKGKWSFLEKKKIICLLLLIFLMARINSPNIYLKKLQFCLLFFCSEWYFSTDYYTCHESWDWKKFPCSRLMTGLLYPAMTSSVLPLTYQITDFCLRIYLGGLNADFGLGF